MIFYTFFLHHLMKKKSSKSQMIFTYIYEFTGHIKNLSFAVSGSKLNEKEEIQNDF